MNQNEQTFVGKLATALFTLLAFLGITAINEALEAIKTAAASFDFTVKPTLAAVGDTLLDALASGGTLIANPTEQTTFEKWVGIIKGGWDAIEGGAGAVISFFEAMIAGHKAKVANEAAQAAK